MLPEPGWAVEFNLEGPAGGGASLLFPAGASTSSANEVGDGRRRPVIEPNRPRATRNHLGSS